MAKKNAIILDNNYKYFFQFLNLFSEFYGDLFFYENTLRKRLKYSIFAKIFKNKLNLLSNEF